MNAFGPAPVVRDAIAAAPVDEYPDPRAVAARTAFARAWNAPVSSVMLGSGSAELIQATCFAYLRPADRVVVVEPAFAEYRRAAALCGATVIAATLSTGDDPLAHARASIEQARPRLVFLASPANPTGIALDRDALRSVADVCAGTDSLLVLDQAYDAFADAPLGTPTLARHSNVLHLRSLTKEHSLAGVRVAVGAAAEYVVESVEAARVPWPTSTAAQAAAIASLDPSAVEHAAASIAQLRAERLRIAHALRAAGIDTQPSTTHYMLIRCPGASSMCARLLAEYGIVVRDGTSFGLPHAIRVAARRPRDNDHLIHALCSTL